VPIGRCIVGFLSCRARPIVEVDGGQPAKSAADRWHAGQGFSVRRHWNSDVLTNAEGVGADILTALGETRPDGEVKR
jgi:very-short-patch-repair endonuclease